MFFGTVFETARLFCIILLPFKKINTVWFGCCIFTFWEGGGSCNIFGGSDIRGGGGMGIFILYFVLLILLDENIRRAATSEWIVQDIRRKDRRTPNEGFGWQNLPVC